MSLDRQDLSLRLSFLDVPVAVGTAKRALAVRDHAGGLRRAAALAGAATNAAAPALRSAEGLADGDVQQAAIARPHSGCRDILRHAAAEQHLLRQVLGLLLLAARIVILAAHRAKHRATARNAA